LTIFPNFPYAECIVNSVIDWLSYDTVRFKVKVGLKRNSCAKMCVTGELSHPYTMLPIWGKVTTLFAKVARFGHFWMRVHA